MQHLNSEKSSSRKGSKVMGKGSREEESIKKQNWQEENDSTGSLCERWVLKSTHGDGMGQD